MPDPVPSPSHPPVRSLSYPAAVIFRKPPALASAILFLTTASPPVALLVRPLDTTPHPASFRPTYRLHDLHNTLRPWSLVSSSNTHTTLVSCPSGDSCSTITAPSFQNLFSRERNHGSAVSSQRANNHCWWSEQSKDQRRPPQAPDVICTALHRTHLERHSRLSRTSPSLRGVLYYFTNCRQPFSSLFAQDSSSDVTEALAVLHCRENASKRCSIGHVTLRLWTKKATKQSRA